MKLVLLSFSLLTILAFRACDDTPPSGGVGPCDWSEESDFIVNNIQLKAPSGMSNYYYGAIPSDRVIRNLQQPLWKGDFWSNTNKAYISGQLVADGTYCTGQISYEYPEGSSEIGLNFLTVLVPANDFLGSATIHIRSDDYKKSSDPQTAQYILWQGSGNDPEFDGVDGNILGSRKEYRPSTGRLPIQGVDCYYLNGTRICP